MRQRKRTASTKGVSSNQRYRRKRKVQYRVQHRKEAVRIRKRICCWLVEVDARAPEFGVAAACDDRAFGKRPECVLDVVVGADDFLAEGHAEPVFGSLVHGYDEDVASSFEGDVLPYWLVWLWHSGRSFFFWVLVGCEKRGRGRGR